MIPLHWLNYRIRRWLIERLLRNLYSPATLTEFYACYPAMRRHVADHEGRITQQHGFVRFRYSLNHWYDSCHEPPYVCLNAFVLESHERCEALRQEYQMSYPVDDKLRVEFVPLVSLAEFDEMYLSEVRS